MKESATTAAAPPPAPSICWSVYMVRTNTGLLYTGISTNPTRRLHQHQRGKGSRALRGKGPLTLAWQQQVGEKGAALRIEYRLKQQPKSFKEQLIQRPAIWQTWSLQWLPSATKP